MIQIRQIIMGSSASQYLHRFDLAIRLTHIRAFTYIQSRFRTSAVGWVGNKVLWRLVREYTNQDAMRNTARAGAC